MAAFLLNPKSILYTIGGAAFGYFLSASFFPDYSLIAIIMGGIAGIAASFFY
ncbi:MAG TPA: hypothetical protein VJJ21_01415 [Candidatus Nanoarchaeia archaeon]|nr:hypothetical protein [Candidatus Nanoarchaeia archaeon]